MIQLTIVDTHDRHHVRMDTGDQRFATPGSSIATAATHRSSLFEPRDSGRRRRKPWASVLQDAEWPRRTPPGSRHATIARMRGRSWAILACVTACRASPPPVPTVAPGAVDTSAALPAADAGAQVGARPGDAATAYPTLALPSPELQSWMDREAERCQAAGPGRLEAVRACEDGPPTVTPDQRDACSTACIEAAYTPPSGHAKPTPSEEAIYQDGLEACIARVDQSLGRGEIRCHFKGRIRHGTTFGDPYQQCETACRVRAAQVRAQWAPR